MPKDKVNLPSYSCKSCGKVHLWLGEEHCICSCGGIMLGIKMTGNRIEWSQYPIDRDRLAGQRIYESHHGMDDTLVDTKDYDA